MKIKLIIEISNWDIAHICIWHTHYYNLSLPKTKKECISIVENTFRKFGESMDDEISSDSEPEQRNGIPQKSSESEMVKIWIKIYREIGACRTSTIKRMRASNQIAKVERY
jgi:hypothetical protein